MTLPTSPADKNWPKGPNFLRIVIGAAVAIIIVLALALFLLKGRGQKAVPMKTDPTPSQTMLVAPYLNTTA